MPSPPGPLLQRRPLLLLAALLSSCFVLLSLQVRRGAVTALEGFLLDATTPFVLVVTEGREAVSRVSFWWSTRDGLLAANAAKERRIEELEGKLLELRDAETERQRLIALLNAHPSPPAPTVPARLLALESAGPFQTALLSQGSKAGIGMGGVVVSARGLLGRIVATGHNTSRVQLLNDRTAAVGVLLVRTGRAAVARGDGAGGLAVLYVPTIADVLAGDVLVTAGTDGVYPRDLPVGRIREVRRSSHSLFLDLPVEPAANPVKEPLVFVLPPAASRAEELPLEGPPAPAGRG